jgi:hypothetical protein
MGELLLRCISFLRIATLTPTNRSSIAYRSRGDRNHLLSMTGLLPFFYLPILAPRRGRFVVTAIPGLHHGAALGDAPLGWTSSMGDVPAALLPLLSLVGANPR